MFFLRLFSRGYGHAIAFSGLYVGLLFLIAFGGFPVLPEQGLVMGAAYGAASLPVTAAELQRLQAGKVLTTNKASDTYPTGVEAKVLINRPIAESWKALYNQPAVFRGDGHTKWVKHLSSPTPATQELEFRLQISPLLAPYQYTTRATFSPALRRVDFVRLRGSFKAFKGYTQLYPLNNGQATLLVYGLMLDSGNPIPRMIQNSILSHEIPSMLKTIRRNIEQ